MNAELELADDIARFTRDPLGAVMYGFPWGEPGALENFSGPYAWQREVLESIGKHLNSKQWFEPLQIAVASGHGIGKSALVGQIIWWALSTCDDARVVITANTGDQLDTKTVPEVSKWFNLAINSAWWKVGTESIKSKEREKTWRADFLTWSLEKTESFAGLHNKGKRIVLIFDEASAIPDKIWEVAEGALTDEDTEIIWIVFGNPTLNSGRFRECFGLRKQRWQFRRQIDSRTVPGTNKAQLDKWVADYGEDSDFVRVRVRGEFPRSGSTQFISSEVVGEARRRNLAPRDYDGYFRILSVDVARFGDDQTIIGERQGPKLTILEKCRGMSTIDTARRVIHWMCERNPRATVIDGDGIGGGVVDAIRDELPDPTQPYKELKAWAQRFYKANPNHELQEFHGGTAPHDPFMYFNRRAECWGMAKKWLETADVPDDPELETDLTGPQYGFSAKNQIQLERKEDMKKRGLASPDIGDMIAMSFGAFPPEFTEEERLGRRLATIEDPLWRHVQQVKATLDRERLQEEDNRPEWMR